MAGRDRAVFTDLWGDDDFRELSVRAQHLYMQLLTHASLSYAGVADWRPPKLGALSSDADADERYEAALELSAEYFIVIDDSTEEVLVRSFMRHDGLLKKPNVAIAMTKAFAEVASTTLRGVIVHELRRLKVEYPTWAAWSHATCAEGIAGILKRRALDPRQLLSVNGSVNPSGKGSEKGSRNDPSLLLPLLLPTTPSNEGEPPLFCSTHPTGADGACGPCGDARRAHAKWEKSSPSKPTVSGIVTDPDCTKHAGHPMRGCVHCAAEAA